MDYTNTPADSNMSISIEQQNSRIEGAYFDPYEHTLL